MSGNLALRIGAVAFVVIVGSYLLLPSVLVAIMSFGSDDLLRFPPDLFSLRWYEEFLGSEPWTTAAIRSVGVAIGAATLSAILGTAAAIAIVRGRLPLRRAFTAVAISPIVVPPIIVAVGGYGIFVRLGLIGSLPGLVLVHTVFTVPVVILLVSAALNRTDHRLELASTNLGAGTWTTYRRITLPLIAPAILSGWLFAFLISFDELVLAIFLVGTSAPTLPIRIFSEITFGLTPIIAAVSTLLLLLTAVALGASGAIGRRGSRAPRIRAERKETV